MLIDILGESDIFKLPFEGIYLNSINTEMFCTELPRVCCVFFSE